MTGFQAGGRSEAVRRHSEIFIGVSVRFDGYTEFSWQRP